MAQSAGAARPLSGTYQEGKHTTIPPPAGVKSGWLSKVGFGSLRKLQQRWFVLLEDKQQLVYGIYKNQKTFIYKGTIELKGAIVKCQISDQGMFTIQPAAGAKIKQYQLYADDFDSAKAWVEAIQKASAADVHLLATSPNTTARHNVTFAENNGHLTSLRKDAPATTATSTTPSTSSASNSSSPGTPRKTIRIATPVVHIPKPQGAMSGELQHQTRGMLMQLKWVPRWCVIESSGTTFQVYEIRRNADSTAYHLLFSIDLSDSTITEEGIGTRTPGFRLIARSAKKDYVFWVNGAATPFDWIESCVRCGATRAASRVDADTVVAASDDTAAADAAAEGRDLVQEIEHGSGKFPGTACGPYAAAPTTRPLEGYLKKQGHKGMKRFHAWKLRWFIQRENKLFYYANPADAKHKGFIDLLSVIDVAPRVFDCPGGQWGIEVTTTERSYWLLAGAKEDMNYWVNGIRALLEAQCDSSTRRKRSHSAASVSAALTAVAMATAGTAQLPGLDTPLLPGEKVYYSDPDVGFAPQGIPPMHLMLGAASGDAVATSMAIAGDEHGTADGHGGVTASTPISGGNAVESLPWLVTGKLIITNYQVVFAADPPDAHSPPFRVHVPLVYISSLVKSTLTLPNSVVNEREKRVLEIESKDVRTLLFLFRPHGKARRQFCEHIYVHSPASIKAMFAFVYAKELPGLVHPRINDGWQVYNFYEELSRQGLERRSQWRVTKANHEFALCDTYPKNLVVPASISDTQLAEIAAFRSKGRIPVLSYLHPRNSSTITRCSQPGVGLSRARCAEDEKMLEAIAAANTDTGSLYILDARPKTNAMGNRVRGYGYERVELYKNIQLRFLNIENIHAMRACLARLHEVCRADSSDAGWHAAVEGWLQHIKIILLGAKAIVELMEVMKTSVLIHCSDGWDRTAQLSSLALLLLDPFYRTIIGFEVLIEKEWIAMGHKFAERLGHYFPQKDSERAPIFLQFLECVWQLMQQFPRYFEFNEHFLLTIFDHAYSGIFGTFLGNNEREREEAGVRSKTISLWTHINANLDEFKSPAYRPFQGVLAPVVSMKTLSLWKGFFLRFNDECRPSTARDDWVASVLDENHRLKEKFRAMREREEALEKVDEPEEGEESSETAAALERSCSEPHLFSTNESAYTPVDVINPENSGTKPAPSWGRMEPKPMPGRVSKQKKFLPRQVSASAIANTSPPKSPPPVPAKTAVPPTGDSDVSHTTTKEPEPPQQAVETQLVANTTSDTHTKPSAEATDSTCQPAVSAQAPSEAASLQSETPTDSAAAHSSPTQSQPERELTPQPTQPLQIETGQGSPATNVSTNPFVDILSTLDDLINWKR